MQQVAARPISAAFLGKSVHMTHDREHCAYITGQHAETLNRWQNENNFRTRETILGPVPVLTHYYPISAATSSKVLISSWTMGEVKLIKTGVIPKGTGTFSESRRYIKRTVLRVNTAPLHRLVGWLPDGTPDIRPKEDIIMGESFETDITIVDLIPPDDFQIKVPATPPKKPPPPDQSPTKRKRRFTDAQKRLPKPPPPSWSPPPGYTPPSENPDEPDEPTDRENQPSTAPPSVYTSGHLASLDAMRSAMPPPSKVRKKSNLLPASERSRQPTLSSAGTGSFQVIPPQPDLLPNFRDFSGYGFVPPAYRDCQGRCDDPTHNHSSAPPTPVMLDTVLSLMSPAPSPAPPSTPHMIDEILNLEEQDTAPPAPSTPAQIPTPATQQWLQHQRVQAQTKLHAMQRDENAARFRQSAIKQETTEYQILTGPDLSEDLKVEDTSASSSATTAPVDQEQQETEEQGGDTEGGPKGEGDTGTQQ